MSGPNLYARLVAIIASGAAVVTVTFGLFGSVLKDMLPHVSGAQTTVNFVSFGTLIVLLALMLFIRRKIRLVAQWIWASISLACLVGAVFLYFTFDALIRDHTFRYPSNAPENRQVLVIYGDLHAEGEKIRGSRDISAAVAMLGGPQVVQDHNLLWTRESRDDVIGRMVRYYAAITFLMTTALFAVAITVWCGLAGGAGSARPKRTQKKAA